jgi:hypothetical protein
MPGSGAQHRSAPGHGLNLSHAGGVEQSSASGSASDLESAPPPVSVFDPVSSPSVVVSLATLSVDEVVSLDEPVSLFAPVSPLVDVSEDELVSPPVPVSPDDDEPSSLLEHAARQIAKKTQASRRMAEASLNGIRAGRQHSAHASMRGTLDRRASVVSPDDVIPWGTVSNLLNECTVLRNHDASHADSLRPLAVFAARAALNKHTVEANDPPAEKALWDALHALADDAVKVLNGYKDGAPADDVKKAFEQKLHHAQELAAPFKPAS